MKVLDSNSRGKTSSVALSVVITNYNYKHLLSRSLSSVIDQLDHYSELIVVDDGSTDGSVDFLKGFDVSESLEAGYFSQSNAGPAAARNNALKWCRGRWVLFLDADDSLEPDGLAPAVSYLLSHPDVNLLLAGHYSESEGGYRKYHPPSVVKPEVSQRLLDYLLYKKVSVSHGCSIFSCDEVRNRPYPESLRQGEDIAVFAYMLSRPGCDRLDLPLATIHKHADSLRNNVELTLQNNGLIAGEVFSRMPASVQPYLAQYKAKRALSAFRSCCKAGRRNEAKAYYRTAFSLAPGQALRWDYLSKWLKLAFTERPSSGGHTKKRH